MLYHNSPNTDNPNGPPLIVQITMKNKSSLPTSKQRPSLHISLDRMPTLEKHCMSASLSLTTANRSRRLSSKILRHHSSNAKYSKNHISPKKQAPSEKTPSKSPSEKPTPNTDSTIPVSLPSPLNISVCIFAFQESVVEFSNYIDETHSTIQNYLSSVVSFSNNHPSILSAAQRTNMDA